MNDTTSIHELIDIELMERMIAEGYVSMKFNSTGSRAIYNYTQRAQFDSEWNDATLISRGLIVDDIGQVRARPFRKFFNLEQLPTIPNGTPMIDEKLDGSLGIGYLNQQGDPTIATRGSFTSEQAIWATDWLNRNLSHAQWVVDAIECGLTPLFEIIYPENRIVIEYGDRAELVLLACIDIATGKDDERCDWPGTFAAQAALTINEVLSLDEPNEEGYVLRWPCGTRAKVKFPNYVRLHKLLTGVNARTIWEILANDGDLDELIELVPDEFHVWVESTVIDLRYQFSVAESAARDVLSGLPDGAERKTLAGLILERAASPSTVFAMLDGKNYASGIWRQIKPEPGVAFWDDAPNPSRFGA